MEFTGVCINKGETRTGEGKNGTWKSLEFVLEDSTGRYPKKAMFEANTKSYDFAAKIKQGDTVKVQYDVDCNEYKGRYYNKLKAFKIEVVGEAQQWTQQSSNSDWPF
jgi:exonuclease VII large subunit